MSEVIQFKPRADDTDAKPMFSREHIPEDCDHRGATFHYDSLRVRVTCGKCEQPVEAIRVVEMLCNSEYWTARKAHADTYARIYAEEKAEKQAAKTRKAALATLFRFGVTPESYADEHRRALALQELELRQDYSKTLPFVDAALS